MITYYYTFYTDGSHKNHSETRLEGAWAYSKDVKVVGLPWRETPLEVHTGASGALLTTNIFLTELTAISEALLSVPEGSRGMLFTDSQIAIRNIKLQSEYTGDDLDKKVLYNKTRKAYMSRRIQIQWIKARSGIKKHDLVDKMAKKARGSIRCRFRKDLVTIL